MHVTLSRVARGPREATCPRRITAACAVTSMIMTRVFLSTRMSGRRRDTWATCAVPTYKVCRRGVALRPPNSRGSQPFPTPPPTHPRTHTSQEATPAGDTTVLRGKQDGSRVKGHETATLIPTHSRLPGKNTTPSTRVGYKSDPSS